MNCKKHNFSWFVFSLICLCVLMGGLFLFCTPKQDVFALTNVEIEQIFEDYTQTKLKDEYNSLEIIESMQNQLDEKTFQRAVDVVRGEVKFSSQREFSTAFTTHNKIDQAGDVAKYSTSVLKCIWPASELILTGIYGMTGDTIKVFVQAEDETKLPSIVLTQNHGYYPLSQWYDKRQLKVGMNEIKFPDFVAGSSMISDSEVRGGAIYLCNPYEEDQGRVDVYIEGGGFYPIFKKNWDENQFLERLKEYETRRAANSKTMLDMADLETDHAIITTTSSSLYDVYFKNDVISPNENMILWGNYMNTIFEFNGIPVSESSHLTTPYNKKNDYVKINFRYMTVYPGSGAYSYTYHIGYYYENYWFANFYNARNPLGTHGMSDHLIFGIGHELGHALDNEPRKINETTNNFSAAIAFVKILGMPHNEQYQPFKKTFNALSNDYKLDYKAYDDGQIMYRKDAYPNDYDHNYLIWWDLEAIFPDFWAKLNNYFRGTLENGLNTTEQYVYYSSLATGVDLSNYYERWGFYYGKSYTYWNSRFTYEKSSPRFKELMQQAVDNGDISQVYDHFWYVDDLQYDFTRNHLNATESEKDYSGGKPTITRLSQSTQGRTLSISSRKSDSHLGYEILSKTEGQDWKVAGFTYTSSFVDTNTYTTTPTYKVVAVNRYFKTSPESGECSSVTEVGGNVAKVGDQYYPTLLNAMTHATKGETVYLLGDCDLASFQFDGEITLQVDESVTSDIYIFANKTYIQSSGTFRIIGSENAKIIIDGKLNEAANPVIYLAGGKFIAENVIFQNLRTYGHLAAAVFGLSDTSVQLTNCTFQNCKNSNGVAVVKGAKKISVDNCKFEQIEDCDVYIGDLLNLQIFNQKTEISLDFDDFNGEKVLNCNLSEENLGLIKIEKQGYMAIYADGQVVVKQQKYNLKFYQNGEPFDVQLTNENFVFGSEKNYNLPSNQYVKYTERQTKKVYYKGDEITLTGDFEFDIEIKNKILLLLYQKSGEKKLFFAENEKFYLPCFDDDGNAVVSYKGQDVEYVAGTTITIKSEIELSAVYAGFFEYKFFTKDGIKERGFKMYGETVTAPNLDEEKFVAWQFDDDVVLANQECEIKKDCVFVALYEDEEKVDLTSADIQFLNGDEFLFTGDEICPEFKILVGGKVINKIYFNFDYLENINVGRASIRIFAKNGLSTGEKTFNFTINSCVLQEEDLRFSGLGTVVFDGNPKTVSIQISWNGKSLQSGKDFSVIYPVEHTNAGIVEIQINFMGNFEGCITKTFQILRANRENFAVSLSDWTYGEGAKLPEVSNKMEEAEVEFSYGTSKSGNFSPTAPHNAGTYYVKASIKASQNYNEATAYAVFHILKAQGSFDVEILGWTYGQKPNKPKITSSTNPTDGAKIYYRKANEGEFSSITPTNAGDYEMKIVLQESANYLSCQKEGIYFTISKATSPQNILEQVVVSYYAVYFKDVLLPANWKWAEPDLKIDRTQQTAVVVFDDNQNYENTVFQVQLVFEDAPKPASNIIWIALGTAGATLIALALCVVIHKRKKIKFLKTK